MRHAILSWHQEFIDHRPAVVHAWQDATCLTAVVAAVIAGVPRILLSTRSSRPDNPRRRLKRYMQRAYRAVMSLPSVEMLNNSRAGAADYEAWLDLEPGTVGVIYNGLDFDRLHDTGSDAEAAQHRQRLGIPADAPVLGGVFRMSEEKRPLLWVDTAAEVLRLVPAAHFVVAGDGPMRDDMVERATQLGLRRRLHLPGHVQVASWFRLMDVVLLTSRMEGLPNVLLEAQSFGIPVVAPAVGGVPETLIQGSTGWAVAEATAAGLAERISFSMTQAEWRRAAGEAARALAREQFSIDAMIGHTLAAYGFGTPTGQGSGEASPPDTRPQPAQPRGSDERRDEAEAEAELRALVAVQPASADAWRRLGRRTQQEHRRAPEALAAWRRLLALEPADFEARFRAGEQLHRLGRCDEALHLLRDAARIKPDHQATRRQVARLTEGSGHSGDALAEWLTLHRGDPQDFEAAYRAGRLALAEGHPDLAHRLLRQACAIDRADFRPVESLTRALMQTGELREAGRVLLAFVRANDAPMPALSLLGTLLCLVERFGLMERVLARLGRRALTDSPAALRYARWCAAWGQEARAHEAMRGLPPSDELNALRVETFTRAGRFGEAVRACREFGAPTAFLTFERDCRIFVEALGAEPGGELDVQSALLGRIGQLATEPCSPVYEPVDRSVVHVVHSLAMGGTERQVALTAAAQTQDCARFGPVTLLRAHPGTTAEQGFYLPYVLERGVSTMTLAELVKGARIDPDPQVFASTTSVWLRRAFSLDEVSRLYRAFVLLKPQIVHLWTPALAVTGFIAACLAGVPRIVIRFGSLCPAPIRFGSLEEGHRQHWMRRLLRLAAVTPRVRLMANSRAAAASWLGWMNLRPAELAAPMGIVANAFDPAAMRSPTSPALTPASTKLNLPENRRIVGTVSRLEPDKNLALWIQCAAEAARRRSSCLFLLVGTGRLAREVRREIDRRGLEDYAILVESACIAIEDIYTRLACYLQVSLSESHPNALVEASHYALPVIATKVGGSVEAIAGYQEVSWVDARHGGSNSEVCSAIFVAMDRLFENPEPRGSNCDTSAGAALARVTTWRHQLAYYR
jgi:glycosyltransferase involved in cell wall biosynthesis/Flp pilus assembly protein TadD